MSVPFLFLLLSLILFTLFNSFGEPSESIVGIKFA